MKLRLLRLVSVALVLLAAGLYAAPAVARPGGGQNYTAPSRSTPSTSRPSSPSRSGPSRTYVRNLRPPVAATGEVDDDDGSGGGLVAGVVLVIVLVFVVLFIISVLQRKQRATVAVDDAARRRGIDALRAQDPGFDPAAFSERARAVMTKINEAWARGQMGPARRFLSDGVYVRFQTQLALLRAAGIRNAMADFRALSADILAAESDPQWDTIHVKVEGEARDIDVPTTLAPDAAERKVKGAPLGRYQEIWSFLRRRGQKTKTAAKSANAPALENHCPGCGADLPAGDVVRCDYCKALVNSGEHDWVLAEITQPEEWRGAAAERPIPGFEDLRKRDAQLSRQELEDRASVMFWKWIESSVTGQRARLDRFCLVPGQPPAPAQKLSKVAVGSAEVTRVAQAEWGVDSRDHAEIEIAWSASVDGAAPSGRIHKMTIARSAEAMSQRLRGLSSLDCPSCGGAVAESDSIKCSYCGETLSGGKHEWALESIAPSAGAAAA